MNYTPVTLDVRANWRGILLVALIAWLLISSAYHSAMAPSPGLTGIDFHTYYDAASRLAHRQALYEYHPMGDTYVYPPLLALILQPITRLPFSLALKAWFFIGAMSLGLSVALYAWAARFRWNDMALVGVTLILGFRFWPSTMNFGLGQVNFPILLMLCGVYLADSRGMVKTAALLIACAALIKTWMLGLLLYLLLRRHWRAAVLGGIAYGGMLVGCFSMVGWREWPMFLKLTRGYANQSIGQIAATQSISGFAYLHFGSNPHTEPLVASAPVFHGFILAGIMLMAVGFVFVWRNEPRLGSYEARLQLGLVMLSLLLLLPMCESEYFILCLPLLWTLMAPAPSAGRARQLSLLVLAGSFTAYLVFTRSWPVLPPIPEAYRHGLKSLLVSADFFAALGLWLVTFYAARREGERSL